MTSATAEAGVVEAWTTAAKELGIDVVTPFRFSVEGRAHECLAWLAHFGGAHGIVLVGISPPDFATDPMLHADATREGYRWSAINTQVYGAFDRERFVEALLDWGFYGPAERRPSWLNVPDRG